MQVIDENIIQYLKSLSPDPQFLPTLIEAFRRDTQAEIPQMKEAHQQHDAKTLRFVAHKYKSSSRNMGASTLSALCLEVEKMALEGDSSSPAVAEKIALIEIESQRAVEALQAFLG